MKPCSWMRKHPKAKCGRMRGRELIFDRLLALPVLEEHNQPHISITARFVALFNRQDSTCLPGHLVKSGQKALWRALFQQFNSSKLFVMEDSTNRKIQSWRHFVGVLFSKKLQPFSFYLHNSFHLQRPQQSNLLRLSSKPCRETHNRAHLFAICLTFLTTYLYPSQQCVAKRLGKLLLFQSIWPRHLHAFEAVCRWSNYCSADSTMWANFLWVGCKCALVPLQPFLSSPCAPVGLLCWEIQFLSSSGANTKSSFFNSLHWTLSFREARQIRRYSQKMGLHWRSTEQRYWFQLRTYLHSQTKQICWLI